MLQLEELSGMKERLDDIVSKGTQLYLEGRQVSTLELVCTCCLNEDAVYMPDYILDENGKLAELRYDRIGIL